MELIFPAFFIIIPSVILSGKFLIWYTVFNVSSQQGV